MKQRRKAKKEQAFFWSEQPGWVAWGEPGWAPMMEPSRLTLLQNWSEVKERFDGERI